MSEELEILCQSCGMCCDGSLFGRVDLEPGEMESARRHRLYLVHGGKAFEQPCVALVPVGASPGGRTCAIYAERPGSCRRFVCRLYDRHRREGGPLEPRLEAVRRVRALAADLEARGLAPADFEAAGPGSRPDEAAVRAFTELTARLEEDFARAG
ncbi:MAG: YkgJ family cysteine cluster protein [Polyangiaceae bacterium]